MVDSFKVMKLVLKCKWGVSVGVWATIAFMITILLHIVHHVLADLGCSLFIFPLALWLSFLTFFTSPQLIKLSCIFPKFLDPSSSLVLINLNLCSIFTLMHSVIRSQIAILIFFDNSSKTILKVFLINRWLLEGFLFTFTVLFISSFFLSWSWTRLSCFLWFLLSSFSLAWTTWARAWWSRWFSPATVMHFPSFLQILR